MKKFMIASIFISLVTLGPALIAQDKEEELLGLPGDNLNLYAVFKLFQQSETLEGFERSLNDKNLKINNLDLDGNGLVDFIMVIDYPDGDVHTIVLRDAVSDTESQDIAVFTVQRDHDGKILVQLIGDEALYGKDYIIEPNIDGPVPGQTPNPGYTGNTVVVNGRNVTVVRTTYIQIASWPLIRFIYLPDYVIWHSSWHYGYYPHYWHPWHPFFWHYYYGYHYNWYNHYYGHYHRCNYYRDPHWRDFYYSGRRSYSANVSVRIRHGNYKDTYSHPDQRRDGEALYNRMHSNRDTYTSRRSGENISNRRSAASASRKTGRNRQHVLNNSSGGNTTSKVSRRSETKQSAGRRADTQVKSKKSTHDESGHSSRRSDKSRKFENSARKAGKVKNTETTKESRKR